MDNSWTMTHGAEGGREEGAGREASDTARSDGPCETYLKNLKSALK